MHTEMVLHVNRVASMNRFVALEKPPAPEYPLTNPRVDSIAQNKAPRGMTQRMCKLFFDSLIFLLTKNCDKCT